MGRCRLYDVSNAGVCVGAAHKGNILEPWYMHIRNEHASPIEVTSILLSQKACANPAVRVHFSLKRLRIRIHAIVCENGMSIGGLALANANNGGLHNEHSRCKTQS
jgi:hypothetical protein